MGVDLSLTPNPDGSVVVPPTSTNLSSWQAPNHNTEGVNLSEPLIIRAAPQPIRQPGHENGNGLENDEDGEPPFSESRNPCTTLALIDYRIGHLLKHVQ